MNYHELLLVPCTGHFGEGRPDYGPNYGHYFEMDVTRTLIEALEEALDNDRIRCRTLAIWNPPGLTREQMRAETAETTISLHLAFGRGGATPARKNATRSWYSEPGAAWLAQRLSECAADWAKCSNFHHEMTNPKLKEKFFPHHSVLLEPFSLVTPDPDVYLRRLPDLAKAMAITVTEFFQRTGQAIRSKPHTAWANDKTRTGDGALVSNFLSVVEAMENQYELGLEATPEDAAEKRVKGTAKQKTLNQSAAKARGTGQP